jgi:hypothetical protein
MAVKILFKNQDLNYFGPTPLVSISSNTGENNSVVNTITLEGKIFLPRVGQNDTTIGISVLIPLENQLRALFEPNTGGPINIKCDNTDLKFLSCDNQPVICNVKSYNANKTSDNWTFSIDYNVELEYINTYADVGNPCPNIPIRSYSDSWEIIPEQDESWYNLQILPRDNSDQIIPAGTAVNQAGVRNNALKYTITHRVGAVSYNAATGIKPANQVDNRPLSAAWMNAKSFVHCYLSKGSLSSSYPFANTNTNNMGVLERQEAGTGFNFYNHIRSFNIDKTNGSYEITDTWLALTKDVSYLEDYTVEYASESQFDSTMANPPCTVTINGSVQGLSIATTGSLDSNPFSHSPPSGTGVTSEAARKIDGSGLTPNKVIAITKAETALHGWYNYIEPALHTRAVALASVLRSENLSQANQTTIRNPNVVNIRNQNRTPNSATQTGLNSINPSGIYLNRNPVSKTFGFNPKTGQITYSYRFASQPNNSMQRITRLSINDDVPSSVVNEIFILGRKRGPLLQDTGASTGKSRTLSIEMQTDIPRRIDQLSPLFTGCPAYSGHPDYKRLLDYVDLMRPILPANWTPVLVSEALQDPANRGQGISLPRGQLNGELYVTSDTDSWDPITGRLGKTVTWKWD